MTTWKDVQSNWMHFKRAILNEWTELTEADLKKIAGKRAELQNTLAKRYEITKNEADLRIDSFLETQTPVKMK